MFVSQRVFIRQPSLHDLENFLDCRNADRATGSVETMSVETATTLLQEQSIKTDSEAGWRMFAICLSGQDQFIGEVGGFVHAGDAPIIDIGWWIAARFRGKGYATEAAQLLLGWCFDHRHAVEVTAHCQAKNAASRRLMERLGMRDQRLEFSGDGVPDEVSFVLSRSAWIQRQQPADR
ncbi:TPA: GNAT family N-acetyltransferase [Burkholderia vietnamiensis]|uniref:GNAT family N-acetyltransferase n=1 Tax=Burkholderia cenocepacia TaxID=95486 RepID=UPI0019066655|nr:GNAT family N-acetyltransferase [Burkholderia cenocepacia]HDR9181097.1 GNAT family N-acetyltransferase [Burkholderia vietnamiensis]HDV8354148.1 GNAT family N-acetyltransferase [Burkholderia vietnamiensis]